MEIELSLQREHDFQGFEGFEIDNKKQKIQTKMKAKKGWGTNTQKNNCWTKNGFKMRVKSQENPSQKIDEKKA